MNGNTGCVMLIIEGSATQEAHLSRDWTSSILSNKISLLSTSGRTCSIAIANPPLDPSEVTAKQPIRRLLQKLVVDHIEVGGHAPRVAFAAAEIRNGTSVQVLLVNEAEMNPELVRVCEKNINQVSTGCIHTPASIVTAGSSMLTDPAPEQEKKVFTLFHRATDLIVTFSQLRKLATVMAKLPDVNLTEWSPQAAYWAAGALRQLYRRKLAGSQSATTALGSKYVVADWLLDRIYVLEFDLLGEHAFLSPVGLSKDFLAAYINYLSWARQSALREPVMAAARRAMQLVADNLRLNSSWYYINVSTL